MRTTGILADYGAEVIWVEPPGGHRFRRDAPEGLSVFARNKQSIVIDPHSHEEIERLRWLESTADVLVHDWYADEGGSARPRETVLGHDDQPFVRCTINGFGLNGPHAAVREEAIVHALLGTMAEQPGHRDGPIFEALPFASIGASHLGVIGILAALYRRADDGVGRRVETSLVDGALAYFSMMWCESDASVAATASQGGGPTTTAGTRIITRSFACADGRFVGVHTGAVGAFGRLMALLGLDKEIPPSSTGLDMGMALRPEQGALLEAQLPTIFASRPASHWVQALRGAEVCAIEHLRPCEVFDQDQAIANEMIVTLDDPALGPILQVAPPAKFASLAPVSLTPAPAPGAQTAEVLRLSNASIRPTKQTPGVPDERPLLDGLKILDLGAYFAGPFSSRLLADLGADVIKVEPVQGDQLRGYERHFFPAQAGKRSLAIDLKDQEVRPALSRLLDWADVVHHNLRPGAAERLGVGYDQVAAERPGLIYLYAPGWGSEGPDRLRQSFAPMMSGFVGVTFEAAGLHNDPLSSPCNEDPGNGLIGAAAILMALHWRRASGRGVYIENPQLNAAMSHMAHVIRTVDGEVRGAGRLDQMQYGFGPLERLFRTRDGWVCIVAREDQEIAALGQALVIPLLLDARFRVPKELGANADGLTQILEDRIAKWDSAELLAHLEAHDVPAVEPVGPNAHAFLNDPDNRLTGRVAECHHPTRGNVRELAHLVRVSGTKPPPHRLAPELGQHTVPILSSLGCTDDEIARLRQRRSIA